VLVRFDNDDSFVGPNDSGAEILASAFAQVDSGPRGKYLARPRRPQAGGAIVTALVGVYDSAAVGAHPVPEGGELNVSGEVGVVLLNVFVDEFERVDDVLLVSIFC
jgi:hypothetical protein